MNWNRTDRAIATELKCSRRLVRVKRLQGGYPKCPDTPGPKPKRDWKQTDWSKTNQQIATEHGCSYQRVYYKRKELVSE
jgi:hypothetical protein